MQDAPPGSVTNALQQVYVPCGPSTTCKVCRVKYIFVPKLNMHEAAAFAAVAESSEAQSAEETSVASSLRTCTQGSLQHNRTATESRSLPSVRRGFASAKTKRMACENLQRLVAGSPTAAPITFASASLACHWLSTCRSDWTTRRHVSKKEPSCCHGDI